MKKFLLGAAILSLAAFCPVYSACAEEVFELSYAHPVGPTHPIHIASAKLFKDMEEESGGRLKVTIYDSNTLVKMPGVLKALKDGGTDIGYINVSSVQNDMPYTVAHDINFAVSGSVNAGKLLEEMEKLPEVKKELTDNNCIYLFGHCSDRFSIGSLKDPIRTPADLKGKRVLTVQSNLADEITNWGGTPVLVGIPDCYVALQRGMGDCVYTALPLYCSIKLHELLKHITIMPSTFSGNIIAINKEAFEDLPEDIQKIMLKHSGYDSTVYMCQMTADAGDRDVKIMQDAGIDIITLTPEELEQWKSLSVAGLQQQWIDTLKRGGVKDPEPFIAKVREMATAVEAQ